MINNPMTILTNEDADIICIYYDHDAKTREATIDNIRANLPFITNRIIYNDVQHTLDKLLSLSDAEFTFLMKRLAVDEDE